jgi:hypothetical protein
MMIRLAFITLTIFLFILILNHNTFSNAEVSTNTTQPPLSQSKNDSIRNMIFLGSNATFTSNGQSPLIQIQNINPIDVDLPSFHFFDEISAAASGNNLYIISDKYYKIRSSKSFPFQDSIPIFNITKGKTPVSGPKIAASGDNVYLLWQNSTDEKLDNIYFRASTDNGASFGKVIELSGKIPRDLLLKDSLKIAASENNVYVAWGNTTTLSFRASTDNGASFGNTTILSNKSGTPFPETSQIIPSLNNVYITWEENNLADFFRASTDNGASFGNTINLSSMVPNFAFAELAASGNNVYSIWTAGDPNSPSDIFYSKSSDAGTSFSPLLKINRESGSSIGAKITASGNNVYIVWTPNDSFKFDTIPDLLFVKSTDNGTNFNQPVKLLPETETDKNPFVSGEGPSIQLSSSDNRVFVIATINFRHAAESHIFVAGSADNGTNFVRTYTNAGADRYIVLGDNNIYILDDGIKMSLPAFQP